ncbi:phage virion morphogenesis protein [Kingella kingae]|uniref:phage virion morphogenesis protein n=1 Tax=Kingella kingae TaxID=504 RepID=UPI00254BC85F|nr:phage virion morphogenesis protein [Kingella kingae]MDK4545786.1 phage virion morphogenesis protein [Kingella kingae]MDK4567694.1 phage virion morphogenesis protein [Kingella kingae]MDK4591575.1 phage virion morphogenesis protein [Kingella kingae]MDK4629533.1 phage virion morphogenesis protein [Kingella kingae]MDK4637437.1 phage virion morphogenesis protein [Kingella kingae]
MIKISVDSRDMERGLSQLLQNIQNRRQMMAGVAAELLSMTEDNFESESWGGERWKETHRGGKKLQLSGQLAASINTQSGNDFARIGSNKKYAAIHHLGGEIQAKNAEYLMIPIGNGRFARKKSVVIPARPYLPIDGSGKLQSDSEKRILDVVKDALAHGI